MKGSTDVTDAGVVDETVAAAVAEQDHHSKQEEQEQEGHTGTDDTDRRRTSGGRSTTATARTDHFGEDDDEEYAGAEDDDGPGGGGGGGGGVANDGHDDTAAGQDDIEETAGRAAVTQQIFEPVSSSSQDEIDYDNGSNRKTSDEEVHCERGEGHGERRDSLFVGELDGFDPSTLDVEDDWGNVFDGDEEDAFEDSSSMDNSRGGGGSTSSPSSSRNISMCLDSLMPPPDAIPFPSPIKDSQSVFSGNLHYGPTGDVNNGSNLSTTIIPPPLGMVGDNMSQQLPSTSRPIDHSITRRKKTSSTADRRDSAPPSWHSEAADAPHRQAMIQDM